MSNVPYHYDRFRLRHYDGCWLEFPEKIQVGKPAPDFAARRLDGTPVRLSDYFGSPIVLEGGSLSCPMYVRGIEGMNDIASRHPELVHLVLYTREAHPGEHLGKLTSLEQKFERARRLQDEESEGRIILVDDLEGTAHREYACLPNFAVLIDKDRNVAFRATWNEDKAMDQAVNRLENGLPLNGVEAKYRRPKPTIAYRTFKRAGGQSMRDFLHELPRIIFHHWKHD